MGIIQAFETEFHTLMPGFTISSRLAPDAHILASQVLTLSAVNRELMPWIKMTAPSPWATQPIPQWPATGRLFTSHILLLGLLPLDRHVFGLNAVDALGFDENSSSLANKYWQHNRRIRSAGQGCWLEDRVEYRSRIPGLDRLLLPFYRRLFQRRHCYLRQHFSDSSLRY